MSDYKYNWDRMKNDFLELAKRDVYSIMVPYEDPDGNPIKLAQELMAQYPNTYISSRSNEMGTTYAVIRGN